MSRRFFSAVTLAALLAVHLGVPCLALARTHDAMSRETSSAPCESSGAPAAKLLCAGPSSYAPLAVGAPDIAAGAPALLAAVSQVMAPPQAVPGPWDPIVPCAAPPAFLLHRALLI
jgi:hypothetical protein